MTKKKNSKDIVTLSLTSEEVEGVKKRIESDNLTAKDRELMLNLLSTIMMLRNLAVRRKFGMLSLLRRIFGVKTEKKKPTESSKKKGGGKSKGNPKGNGHGRNGEDQYTNAERLNCQHDELADGDRCPECGEGVLKDDKPAIHQHWTGHSPLQLTLYALQRLVCNSCRTVYRANLPENVQQSIGQTASQTTDAIDSDSDCDAEIETTTSKESPLPDVTPGPTRSTEHGPERSYNISADVMVALLRYDFGVPNHRLARIQKAFGIPLPAGTQWGMILRVFLVVVIIYRCLWRRSANSNQFFNDDTRMKILACMASEGKDKKKTSPPPKNKNGSQRKSVQTTCILAEVDGHRSVLYATGHKNAGENLNDILALRDPGLPLPRQMCDGLADNTPADYGTDQSNCLDHARRKFYDFHKSDEEEVDYVLSLFAMVYHNDKKTRQMTDEERLKYHQIHSSHIMDELEEWMTDVYDVTIEPNSNLGGSIKYMSKRWKKLTRFLRVAGAPLANAACERKIKSIIPHRKASLFFKNMKGAFVGDAMMSVIQTCIESKKSPVHYLTTICRHVAEVRSDPDSWLPWNYEINSNS